MACRFALSQCDLKVDAGIFLTEYIFDQKVYTTQKFFKMRGKELARKETERKIYYIAVHSQNLKLRRTSGNS